MYIKYSIPTKNYDIYTRNIFIIEDENYTVLNTLKDIENNLIIVELPQTYNQQDFFQNLQSCLHFDEVPVIDNINIHTNICENSQRLKGILNFFQNTIKSINYIKMLSDNEIDTLEKDFTYFWFSGDIYYLTTKETLITSRLNNFSKLPKLQKIAFINGLQHSKSSVSFSSNHRSESDEFREILERNEEKLYYNDVTVEDANKYG